MAANLLAWFSQGWVGSALGILGVGIAVYTIYRRSGPHLVFQTRINRLFADREPLPPDVAITYRGEAVPQLTSTRVTLWNAGRGPIQGASIVRKDPLRIEFPPTAVVLAISVTPTRSPIDATARRGDQPFVVLLDFSFLDRRDGMAVDIMHTGDAKPPAVAGTIIGLPRGVRDWGTREPPTPWKRALLLVVSGMSVGTLFATFAVVALMPTVERERFIAQEFQFRGPEMIPVGAFLASVLLTLGFSISRRSPNWLGESEFEQTGKD